MAPVPPARAAGVMTTRVMTDGKNETKSKKTGKTDH